MPTALITGGSSGLGEAFARALAHEGFDLILVARAPEPLTRVADALTVTTGVRVTTVSADLGVRADVDRVAALLSDAERPVDLLVNNAGFGVRAPLAALDTSPHERAIDVMILAVLRLGAAAAHAMAARGTGTIINVSSVAGYMRMGGYSAVKAWVTAYSESLAVELRGSGVRVLAVTPGWVRTAFHARADIDPATVPGALWTTPDVVVRAALGAARRGRVLATPTLRFRLLEGVIRLAPRAGVRWVSGRISSSRHRAAAHQVESGTR